MNLTPTVFILDDDASILRAMTRVLQVDGFVTRTWTSARTFLAEHDPSMPGCLLTDLVMPEMTGLQLQKELRSQGCERPIIFITAYGNMEAAVEGMRAGAVNFLPKPVRRDALRDSVRDGLSKDAALRAASREKQRVFELLETLTAREHEVLELVALGFLNKQIAATLNIAEKTTKVHRGRLMQKMHVKSAAALAKLLIDVESPLIRSAMADPQRPVSLTSDNQSIV